MVFVNVYSYGYPNLSLVYYGGNMRFIACRYDEMLREGESRGFRNPDIRPMTCQRRRMCQLQAAFFLLNNSNLVR